MDEYLTTKELSQRIKYAPGSIRNLIHKGVLMENIHFVKPTARKLLFKWSAVEAWLQNRPIDRKGPVNRTRKQHNKLILDKKLR